MREAYFLFSSSTMDMVFFIVDLYPRLNAGIATIEEPTDASKTLRSAYVNSAAGTPYVNRRAVNTIKL